MVSFKTVTLQSEQGINFTCGIKGTLLSFLVVALNNRTDFGTTCVLEVGLVLKEFVDLGFKI